jgi:hypothetical protein
MVNSFTFEVPARDYSTLVREIIQSTRDDISGDTQMFTHLNYPNLQFMKDLNYDYFKDAIYTFLSKNASRADSFSPTLLPSNWDLATSADIKSMIYDLFTISTHKFKRRQCSVNFSWLSKEDQPNEWFLIDQPNVFEVLADRFLRNDFNKNENGDYSKDMLSVFIVSKLEPLTKETLTAYANQDRDKVYDLEIRHLLNEIEENNKIITLYNSYLYMREKLSEQLPRQISCWGSGYNHMPMMENALFYELEKIVLLFVTCALIQSLYELEVITESFGSEGDQIWEMPLIGNEKMLQPGPIPIETFAKLHIRNLNDGQLVRSDLDMNPDPLVYLDMGVSDIHAKKNEKEKKKMRLTMIEGKNDNARKRLRSIIITKYVLLALFLLFLLGTIIVYIAHIPSFSLKNKAIVVGALYAITAFGLVTYEFSLWLKRKLQ